MLKYKYCGLVMLWLFLSCREENPSPVNFIDYEIPYHEYFKQERLAELNEVIHNGTYGDIHSLIILRNDKIVFENYYRKYQRDDLHPIGAATQSIVSALVGAALLDNEQLQLSTKIIDLLPEYGQYFVDIPQKDQIEIRDLMSNSSGLWWDEWTHPFGSEENDAYLMSISDDWVGNVLSTPMIREPGFEFNFNSGNGILMAPILQNITGKDLEGYTKEKLFDPLEISDWKWEKIPGEYVNASWGLQLRPIDLAKFGYLFLENGIWGEKIIFDEFWRNRSTRNRSNVSNYFNYGYFWWRFTYFADAVQNITTNDVFFAWGDGGQFLFVVPHLDMVVVITAGNYGTNETMGIAIIRDYIFTSITDRFQ